MISTRPIRRWACLGLFAALVGSVTPAEDVEKKWRVGVALGGYNPVDEIASNSANQLVLVDRNLEFQTLYVDPRDDSSVFGNLDVQNGIIAAASAQYAFTKIFLLEGSIGYVKSDVGDVEVQGQFQFSTEQEVRFQFLTFRVPAGELTRIPLQLTAMGRFRPRAKFNPYVGAGIGYSFLGFDSSDEFDQLSRNMDASLGGQARLTSSFPAFPTILSPAQSDIKDLQGAEVDVRDTFEWHVVGGAELAIRRKWAMFLDLRFSVASRDLGIGFNGGEEFGRSVPQLADFVDSPAGQRTYGPVLITQGGLVDAGSFVSRPKPDQDPNTDCVLLPDRCDQFFDPTRKDGRLDPGLYYAQGGRVAYDGWTLLIGVRYTF